MCVYSIHICIHIFCMYIYKTLPFKMLHILTCLITCSWCHSPSFSMPCFSSILEVRAKVSDSGSASWQEYLPGHSEHFIKHLIRGHMMSARPIIRYRSLSEVVTTSLHCRYVFFLQLAHHSVGDALEPSEYQQDILWNCLGIYW